VSHLPLPDSYVTNLAFGGRDRRDVIVTLSRTGAIGKLRWPEPGIALNFNPY
jgi:gluconolactonase